MEQTLLFRSPDGGRTWTGPQPLDLLGREPYLTVLKNGTVFITGHLLAQDVRNEWGYTTGFLHRSTDGGRTWQSTRVESEQIKPKASNHTTRNVLELSDGSLLLGGKRPADHIGPMRHSGRQRLGSRLVRLAGSVVGRRRSTSRR